MKPTLYVTIGLMGAGKSTYCNELESKGVDIHSSDDIRMELFSTYDCMDKHKEVFETLYARVRGDLKNGKDCCIDATNLTYKTRKKMFADIRLDKNPCNTVAIVFATPFEVCLDRNANRQRKVPEYVIYNAREQFQFPLPNEFGRIDIVYEEEYIGCYKNLIEPTIGYNQDSPHHSLTLDKHLDSTHDWLVNNIDNKDIIVAGAYHDIGKPLTRKLHEDGKIRYINHENVSAYNFLTNCIPLRNFLTLDIIYITQLINNHMRPYTWKEEKTIEKYRRIFGRPFFNDLMILHEADKRAH